MSAYQKPVEDLSVFNSAVFDEANTESLSLSKAQSLFLGRTGNPTSVASNTTFTGLLTVSQDSYFNGVRIGKGGATASTNCVLGGSVNAGSNNCTSVGNGVVTQNSFATSIGAGSQALNNYSTALGYGASSTGINSTAIGYNSTASANQISLGTATEYVTCKGTNTSNGALQLDGGLVLQTGAYGAVPASNMLGYSFTSAGTSVASITNNTDTNFSGTGGISIPTGVWSISWTLYFSNAAAATFTTCQLGVSTSSTSFSGIVFPSGYIISGATEAFSGAGNSIKSGSFTYTNTSASNATLYVLGRLAISVGAFAGVATAYLTRIG